MKSIMNNLCISLAMSVFCLGCNESEEASAPAIDGTFAALQIKLFKEQGCTEDACHGSAMAGELDLRADVAFSQLVEVPSYGSSLSRVEPGDRNRSYLYLKLAAALEDKDIEVAGSPMPIGREPIPSNLMEALRLWIYAGAPASGTVDGTSALLNTALPPVRPLTIAPLPPPEAHEGFQLEMPPWVVPAGSEREICMATYFDIRSQIPDQFKDETGEYTFVGAEELRQDPQSHHLILNISRLNEDHVNDPAFGAWSCRGGAQDGTVCDPLDLTACGSGHCATAPRDGFACIGYGPPLGSGPVGSYPVAGAQKAQDYRELPEGVYFRFPLRGIFLWNSHAFNLTGEDHEMNGRINMSFAERREHRARGLIRMATQSIFKPNTAPFEREEVCSELVLPKGARLLTLSSHTHKRGEYFSIFHPDGTLLYENYVYNDPLRKHFEPPLAFDSEEAELRSLRYCAIYNNGVGSDGSPDADMVTRYSRMPDSVNISGVPGRCSPQACAEGRIGEACDGPEDHEVCDSNPGAGDGLCDACAITGGESTENEMFLILGDYYVEQMD